MGDKSQERDVLELVSGGPSGDAAAPVDDAQGSTEGRSGIRGESQDDIVDGAAQITAPAEMTDEEFEQLRADIVAALKTVHDPEIPADIYELGLIYRVDIADNRDIDVTMTLTAPACPVAGEMPVWVENAVASVAGVGTVTVNLTFEPPWDMSRMSDEARLALNMF